MKEKITITIDEEILKKLQTIAEKESRTISGLINKTLKDSIKSDK
ncbi:MAG TPA: hypothetical protein VIK72_19365 [Clostridiaceae bacterium]